MSTPSISGSGNKVIYGLTKSTVFILGFSLILSSFILGISIYNTRGQKASIHVIGSATKRYDSDILKWRLTLTRTTDMNDVKTGYQLIQKDLSLITQQLTTNGIAEKDIVIQPISSMPKFEQNGRQVGFILNQSLFVVSTDIPKLEKQALNPTFIFEKGIILQQSDLEYYFSKLADIKKDLLAEATKDARRRADEIAKNGGVQIDKIINARSGIFQITEPYSTEISDYGIYNTRTKVKDITITMNVTFTLK